MKHLPDENMGTGSLLNASERTARKKEVPHFQQNKSYCGYAGKPAAGSLKNCYKRRTSARGRKMQCGVMSNAHQRRSVHDP